MKLVSYLKEGHEQLAILVNDILYDTDTLHPELPSTMSMFLNYWEDYSPLAKKINESIIQGKISLNKGVPLQAVSLLSPVPIPSSCRAVSVFGQNDLVVPPAFCFTSHHNVQPPDDVNCMPDYFDRLNFQPGIGIVICKNGRNIVSSETDSYIGGYLLWNAIRSGVSDGSKAVATVLGPWLVTPDELESFLVPAKDGHSGNNYNLELKCHINSIQVIEANIADMNYSFAEIIESCAYGADLQPGDIIGCTLINTAMDNTEYWLQKGDVIDIEIEGLGISTSKITAEDSEFSLKKL